MFSSPYDCLTKRMGLLHAPAREVGLDDAPLGLERAVDRQRRDERHGLLSEPLDDNHVQLLFRVRRKPYGHRAERYRHVAFPAVRVERDMVRVPHRASAGKVVHLVHPTPRQHAASLQPYDEVPGFAAIASAVARTHFPKRVNARLMPSAMA